MDKSNYCLIIDPGCKFSQIQEFLESNKIILSAILLTHGHFDHILSAQALQEWYQINIFIHEKDFKLLRQANSLAFLSGFKEKVKIPSSLHFYDDRDIIKIQTFELNLFHTPGHTSGSVCIFNEKVLFSGDLLLRNKIGRSDLPAGNTIEIKNSIKKLSALNPNIEIY